MVPASLRCCAEKLVGRIELRLMNCDCRFAKESSLNFSNQQSQFINHQSVVRYTSATIETCASYQSCSTSGKLTSPDLRGVWLTFFGGGSFGACLFVAIQFTCETQSPTGCPRPSPRLGSNLAMGSSYHTSLGRPPRACLAGECVL